MSTSDKSTVPYKSVLLFLGGALAAYSAFCAHQAYIAEKPLHDRGLRRSNALTRRRRRDRLRAEHAQAQGDVPHAATTGGENLHASQVQVTSPRGPESETSSQSPNGNDHAQEPRRHQGAEPGAPQSAATVLEQDDMRSALGPDSRVMGLIFQIAENDSRQSAVVHRSVQCDGCGVLPITGVRYRCTTCADYDLCDSCECQDGIHPKTHLFLKIRIPAMKLGNVARQHTEVSIYPGRYTKFLNGQPEDLIQDIMTVTRSSRPLVDSWWESYKAMAGTPYPDGCLHLPYAIGLKDLCYAASPDEALRDTCSKLVYERQFAAFDENQDGLIDFREYCMAKLNIASTADSESKWQFVFRAYDFDNDGYINREDCLMLLRAIAEATKELTRGLYLRPTGGAFDIEFLDSALAGSQPLSAFFNGEYETGVYDRQGEGKTTMPTGDLVVTDGQSPYASDDSRLGDSILGIADRWELNFFGSLKPSEWTEDFVDQIRNDLYWPPYGIEEQDLFGVNDGNTNDQASPNKLDEITDNATRSQICVAAYSRLQKERERNDYREQSHQRSQIRTLAGASECYRLLSLQQREEQEINSDKDIRAPVIQNRPNDVETKQVFESAYLSTMFEVSLRALLEPLFGPYEQLSSYVGASWFRQASSQIDVDSIWNNPDEKKLVGASMADLDELMQSGTFQNADNNAGLNGISFCRAESISGTGLYEAYIERRFEMGLIAEEDYNVLRIRHNDARKAREEQEKTKTDSPQDEATKERLKIKEIAEAVIQVSEQENWNAARLPSVEAISEMSLEGLLASSGYMKSGEEGGPAGEEAKKTNSADDEAVESELPKDSVDAPQESSTQATEIVEIQAPPSRDKLTTRPLMVEVLMRNDVEEIFSVKARLLSKIIGERDAYRGGQGRITAEQFARMVALIDEQKREALSSWTTFSAI